MSLKKYDIGLVTTGFANNYGAILTAYSLYDTLQRNGYSVLFIKKPKFMWPEFKTSAKSVANRFIKKYIKNTTKTAPDREDLKQLNEVCDTFMLGSDQLWNKKVYATSEWYTLLDFAQDDKRKISYATSFGHGTINASPIEIYKMSCLFKRFDAISVREDSGVTLCKDVFGVDAQCNVDPVFLSDRSVYEDLAKNASPEKPETPYLFAYILDGNPEKQLAMEKFAEINSLSKVITVEAENTKESEKLLDMPITRINSVEEWLNYFASSEVIVTDSFHACCFAIIFNKPFYCFINDFRGATRFESLFSKLNLMNRIVTPEELGEKVLETVDFAFANARMEELKTESLRWLFEALSKRREYITRSEFWNVLSEHVPYRLSNKVISGIEELALGTEIKVCDIVAQMPPNSIFCQAQGKIGQPIIDVPCEYGVLHIVKTTDYFVQITFTQMTIRGKDPAVYVGQWIHGDVVDWVKLAGNNAVEQKNDGGKVDEV